MSQNDLRNTATITPPRSVAGVGGIFIMQHRWAILVAVALVAESAVLAVAQAEPGPYARIAIMRAIDGHGVEWEEGYVRHLEWHRRVEDPFNWYSYTVWASTERQRWIVYATFGHAARDFDHAVQPADDERDNLLNVLPHAQFLGNWIYEFLPSASRGHQDGVPTPVARAELTTLDLRTPGAASAFEAALAAAQPGLQGETLWYRLVVGGQPLRYIRLRPRASLAAILDDRMARGLPEAMQDVVSTATVEVLNLRPNMLVNVTPQ
jgi:hypothetical protein